MPTVHLGRTGLSVNQTGFGALPIQRVSFEETGRILNRALDAGVNFIDTARAYSDSEEKIGRAIASRRSEYILATKTRPVDAAGVAESIDASLKLLKTDYIDIFQAHNPKKLPVPGDGTGCYDGLLAAKKAGKCRFIGLTAHSYEIAIEGARSGLYDTVQYPFSMLSTGPDLAVPEVCKENNVGFIAMKAVAGGLIRNIPAAFAFMRRFAHVLPIWGIQRMEELEQFIALDKNPPAWDAAMEQAAAAELAELGASFCRGCGYCLPCPADIEIPKIARIMLFLHRAPVAGLTSPKEREGVARVQECIECGACIPRCPYGLNPQQLVKSNAEGYARFLEENGL